MRNPSKTLTLALLGLAGVVVSKPARSNVPCPTGMVFIDGGFCIDRFEASLLEVLPNGQERPWSPYLAPERVNVRAVSAHGVVPQGYISQVEAARACARSGKRLCTEREWFRACRGPREQAFGYGAQRQQGRCNENHNWHPVVRLFGGTVRYLWGFVQMNDPQLNQLPGTVALTGAHRGCSNEFGVYDMVGNLHEWTSDPQGTFRGGYYMDTTINGDGCWYRTAGHNTTYHDYSIGFRCCATAE